MILFNCKKINGLVVVVSLLFYSCSLQRGKPHNNSPVHSITPLHDSVSIYKKLSFPAVNMNAKTGIYSLENGGESLFSRLWLIDNAQRSIDIQYYSYAKDVTGLIVSDHIVRAADKGVKIRIVIDDAATRMRSHEIELLDSHKNIEIRIYNAGLMLGRLDRRIGKLVKNSNRLLRRMHNKTFTVDDQICITGGRNISDEYFDYDRKYNFRDRDVLLIGKAVGDVKISFEKFWKDTLTVTYSELSGKGKKRRNNDSVGFYRLHRDAAQKESAEIKKRVMTFPEEIKSAQLSGALRWIDQVSFISDDPGKNEEKQTREGGICKDSIVSLIRQAKISIDIQSPYFIWSKGDKQLIQEAIDRGVKIRLLTNSMASIDNVEAFSAYQKDRKEILKAGIEVYEFKPDAKVRFKRMIPEVQAALNYKPVYGFHSKTLIIDGVITVIGSYNLDPRSANYNTECIVVIRSDEVAKNLSGYVEEEFLPENAWLTTLDCNHDSEAGIKKRIKVLYSKLIPKKLL